MMTPPLTDNLFDFITANATADTARLRLRHHGDTEMLWAAMQIDCRRRSATKLAATLARAPRFIFPTEISAQQCTSDALAELHATLIPPGERVLDMTAGLGIDALHIASRAASVTAIDITPEVVEALRHNAAELQLTNVTPACADSTQWIHTTSERFDTVFIDPARRGEQGERLYALGQCRPDVVALMPHLREITGRVIVKASPMLDISRTLEELPGITDIYLYGTATECKELTAVVSTDASAVITPMIHAVTPGAPGIIFTLSEETEANPEYVAPAEGMILHEPLPAVMKSGCFRLLSARFKLAKADPRTHLYFSGAPSCEAPTRQYRIEKLYEFSKRAIAECARAYPKANIAVRNFIIGAPELAKRLKVREGGDAHIFGFTASGKKMLAACRRVCPSPLHPGGRMSSECR